MNIQKISAIFGQKRRILLIIPILLASILGTIPTIPALADGTTLITITKYAGDYTSILDQITLDYQTMEALLPVQGNGVIHQYLQGPVFEGDTWDPGETVNIKDWGANKGTDLMDLCDLVGGMSSGDTVEIKASDGLSRTYDYPNVYTPEPRQGKMVICWWCDGQYVPAWQDGMRLVFFAETTNPNGLYVFGNWDQHECFPENRWYFYSGQYPTTTGHSVKYIDEIKIYSAQTTEYNLDISVSGNGTTSPSAGVHSYAPDTVVDIAATPASGWQFSNWTGSVADSNSAITTVTLDGDKTIIANFNQITQDYDLTIEISGSGTTTPSAGVHSYVQGSVVNINATPASGWQFIEWTGSGIDNPDSAATTVIMDGDKTITAYFDQITQDYDLTIEISGSGTTTPTAGVHSYTRGTVVHISATPASGWQFTNWTGSGMANPDSATTTVTMNRDRTVTAIFTQITQSCDLTIEISGSGTTTPSAGIYSYSQGTMVNITAIPDDGWQFVNWTGSGIANPDSADTIVTINNDMTILANFAQSSASNDLTIVVSGSGTTTPSAGIYSYSQGTMVNITAIPDGGWQFAGWTGSVADPNSATTTVIMNDNITIVANFVQSNVNYNLTIAVSGNGTTTPSIGINTYSQGTIVNITAVPEDDWQFVKWIGNVVDPNSATTTVVMDADKIIMAEFAQELTGKVASSESPETTLKSAKTPQEIPWYIILAIAGGIVAVVVLMVAIIRDLRRR